MGSVVPYKGAWRAHVCVNGRRKSKVFPTRREAKRWAEDEERTLEKGVTALTFGQAAERWMEWRLPRATAEFAQAIEQSLRAYVLPELGERPLAEIRRKEIINILRRVDKEGKVETAHRLGQRIRQIYDYMMDEGEIEEHQMARLSRTLSHKDSQHQSAVKHGELPQLLRACDAYPSRITGLALLLLAHTFVRTRELVGLRWDEYVRDSKLPVLLIAGERMKAGLPHVVPVSPQVAALLEEARGLSGDSPFVLAGYAGHMNRTTMLYALYQMGYRGRMTGHGFRAIASSALNQSGLWHRDAIERQLAHKETDAIRDAYMRADFLEERTRMMRWWSEHLESLMRGSTAA